MFQKERRVIGTAARDGDGECRAFGAQPFGERGGRAGVGVKLAARRDARLGDLGRHKSLAHRAAPPASGPPSGGSVSSATKS